MIAKPYPDGGEHETNQISSSRTLETVTSEALGFRLFARIRAHGLFTARFATKDLDTDFLHVMLGLRSDESTFATMLKLIKPEPGANYGFFGFAPVVATLWMPKVKITSSRLDSGGFLFDCKAARDGIEEKDITLT